MSSVGYVEFFDKLSVPRAVQMSGQKLLGYPIHVQETMAEKNMQGNSEPYVQ
jgi:RNA-binding protein 39